MASSVGRTQVFQAYFSIFQANVEAFRLTGLLWWQKLTWPRLYNIFRKSCRFCSSILLTLYVSYSARSDARFKFDSDVISLTNHNSFATHSNQRGCFILYRQIKDHVKWLFSCLSKWAKNGFRVMLKDFEIKKLFLSSSLFLYYIKQIDSMVPCVCLVIDQRRCQDVVHTRLSPCVPLFCSYHILTSSVIYYWTEARQHGIYLLIETRF